MPSSIRLVGVFETTISIKISGYSRKAVISLEGDESETMDYRRLEVLRKLRTVLEQEWRIEFVPESHCRSDLATAPEPDFFDDAGCSFPSTMPIGTSPAVSPRRRRT
jgi:hypothetical protein